LQFVNKGIKSKGNIKLTLLKHGIGILTHDNITNITYVGCWILIDQVEYFIPFNEYQVFRQATIAQIHDFQAMSPDQVYWKSLDCDIELKALKEPQNYPLQYNAGK
jgi:hypothetical protein